MDNENIEVKKLISIIEDMTDYEEVSDAMLSLYRENTAIAIKQFTKILENKLGDIFIQAYAIDLIFEVDKEYILNYFKSSISKMHYYLFGTILSCFIIESEQAFGKNISNSLINDVKIKFISYNEEERVKIKQVYVNFINSYSMDI